jgi:hypothetical protein
MIIKSLSRKSGIKQVLNYLFKDENKLRDSENRSFVIRKNVRSKKVEKIAKEFEKNEALRIHNRINNVKVYHTVISFSNKDKNQITESMLRDISNQYMKLRGNDNMYVGTAHYDHDHVHLHFVVSGTKYLTGKANRQSKAEFQKVKFAMDSYQREKYPQLINSLPKHGKAGESVLARNSLNGHIRATQKESLFKCVEMAYKTKSLDGFLSHLKQQGHEPYFRNGKLTGVKYDGDRKFRFQTLGYDKEKISRLEVEAEKEKQELDELSEIRDNASGRDLEANDRTNELDEDDRDDFDNTDDEDIR